MKIRVIGGMLMLGYCVQVTATGVVWAKPSPVPAPHKVEPHKVESHKVQLHQAESDKDELHQVTAAQNGRLTRISPAKNTVEPPKQDVVGTTQTPPRHIAPVHHLGMTPAVPAGDLVAPLSNGLSLKWSLSEVRQKFGQPKLGGGV